MKQFFKIAPFLALTLAIAFAKSGRAEEAPCPTDLIRPFAGVWQGTSVLTSSNGNTLNSGTKDIFTIHGCGSFEISVNYLDSSGQVARSLHLNATAEPSGRSGYFTIIGVITEGQNISPMNGSIDGSHAGTLLGQFSGAIGGQHAYLSEVMTLENGDQLSRTIQMSADHLGGSDIGTRSVQDNKIQ